MSYRLMGIQVDVLTKDDLLKSIATAITCGSTNSIIGNHNLHSVYLYHRNPAMREFYTRNTLTHIDGMSLIFIGKTLGLPLKLEHRTGYLDWFREFLQLAEQNLWSIYFLGATPDVANGVPGCVNKDYPNLRIRSHHGYDAFSTETTIYQEIKDFMPDVLLVGMGMPRQEQWILQSLAELKTKVILPCGAIMDYYLGAQKAAPRWLGQIGLEWLFRLIHDPKRLFFRYVVEPITLVPLFCGEWLQRRDLV